MSIHHIHYNYFHHTVTPIHPLCSIVIVVMLNVLVGPKNPYRHAKTIMGCKKKLSANSVPIIVPTKRNGILNAVPAIIEYCPHVQHLTHSSLSLGGSGSGRNVGKFRIRALATPIDSAQENQEESLREHHSFMQLALTCGLPLSEENCWYPELPFCLGRVRVVREYDIRAGEVHTLSANNYARKTIPLHSIYSTELRTNVFPCDCGVAGGLG